MAQHSIRRRELALYATILLIAAAFLVPGASLLLPTEEAQAVGPGAPTGVVVTDVGDGIINVSGVFHAGDPGDYGLYLVVQLYTDVGLTETFGGMLGAVCSPQPTDGQTGTGVVNYAVGGVTPILGATYYATCAFYDEDFELGSFSTPGVSFVAPTSTSWDFESANQVNLGSGGTPNNVNLKVAGSTCYYAFLKEDGNSTRQLWFASMDVDGSGYTATKLTSAASHIGLTPPKALDIIVGTKAYICYSLDVAGYNQMHLGMCDLDGTNWSSVQLTTTSHDYGAGQIELDGTFVRYVHRQDYKAGFFDAWEIHTANSDLAGGSFSTTRRTTGANHTQYWGVPVGIEVNDGLIHYTAEHWYANSTANMATMSMTTGGTGWAVVEHTSASPSPAHYCYKASSMALDSVDDKLYYLIGSYNGTTTRHYLASMNTDLSGWTSTELAQVPNLMGGYVINGFNQICLDDDADTVHYLLNEYFGPGPDSYNIATATSDTDGSNFQYARRVSNGSNFGPYSLGLDWDGVNDEPQYVYSQWISGTPDVCWLTTANSTYLGLGTPMGTPTDLQADGVTGNLTYCIGKPVFTAVYHGGTAATHIEIEVDNDSDFGSPIWDTGKYPLPEGALVDGARNQGIQYGSYPTAPATERHVRYYWRLRYYSGDLVSAWAHPFFIFNNPPEAPTYLHCEGSTNPTNVGDPTPEFSAVYNDVFDPGQTATMYRLQVDDTSTAWGSLVWDSGVNGTSMAATVEGSRCSELSYNGSTLVGAATYYWRIKFWDDDGAEGSWSTAAQFSTSTVPVVTTVVASILSPTSALLNGNLTNDLGEACSYSFEYGTATGVYPYTTAWQGTVTTGTAFNQTAMGLTPGTTYYYRARAYNSYGTGYGTELTVTTNLTNPAITTINATDVSLTTAQLNAYLDSDGGEATNVRFQLGTSPGSYSTTSAWESGHTTGGSPLLSVSGLDPSTTYYFRAECYNSYNGAGSPIVGAELFFTTGNTSELGKPDNLEVLAISESEISVTWERGLNAQYTMVRYKAGAYPEDYEDGLEAYYGDKASVIVSDLVPGTTYFFGAWSYCVGNATHYWEYREPYVGEGNYTADAGTTTTSVNETALEWASDDYYNGCLLYNVSRNGTAYVIDYDGGNTTLTLATAIASQAPNDTIYLMILETDVATTLAGESQGDIYDLPDGSNWFMDPDITRMEDMPFYPFIVSAADGMGMPATTMFVILGLMMVVAVGMVAYFKTRTIMGVLWAETFAMLMITVGGIVAPWMFFLYLALALLGGWVLTRETA